MTDLELLHSDRKPNSPNCDLLNKRPEVIDETYSIDAGEVLVVNQASGLIANDRSANASRPSLQWWK